MRRVVGGADCKQLRGRASALLLALSTVVVAAVTTLIDGISQAANDQLHRTHGVVVAAEDGARPRGRGCARRANVRMNCLMRARFTLRIGTFGAENASRRMHCAIPYALHAMFVAIHGGIR